MSREEKVKVIVGVFQAIIEELDEEGLDSMLQLSLQKVVNLVDGQGGGTVH